MRFLRVIRKQIKHEGDDVQVAGDVNAVFSANVNEPGSKTHVSSRQNVARASASSAKKREKKRD